MQLARGPHKAERLLITGLTMRSNLIQTGSPNLSAQDVKNLREPHVPKALSINQMKLVIRTNELVTLICDNELCLK